MRNVFGAVVQKLLILIRPNSWASRAGIVAPTWRLTQRFIHTKCISQVSAGTIRIRPASFWLDVKYITLTTSLIGRLSHARRHVLISERNATTSPSVMDASRFLHYLEL